MKRQLILVLLFINILLPSNGQENILSIGIFGSMEGCYYDFKKTISNINYDYRSQIGYSFGLGLRYCQKGKLLIKSGLTYYVNGYQVKYIYDLRDEFDSAFPRQSDLSLYYLKVPLSIGYEIFNLGKLKFTPSIGLNTAFQINYVEHSIFEDNSEKESGFLSKDLNKTLIALYFGLGFEYKINDNLMLEITPFISKGLNKMNDSSMNTGQLSYGGLIGLYYKLKRNEALPLCR